MKQVIGSEKIPIKLWSDDIDDGALEQAKNLANLPFAFKHIALMPDCHQGYGMPIGGVMATRGAIVPNAVGVDIGCGMRAIQTDQTEIDSKVLKKIMGRIRELVPVGFSRHKTQQEWDGFNKTSNYFSETKDLISEIDSARYQLGTLGVEIILLKYKGDLMVLFG